MVVVRNTDPRDFDGITDLCRRIYPDTPPWDAEQLSSHLRVFPEGQFVAVYGPDEKVVGMWASLIVDWEDYRTLDSWDQFTADGMFTNHDPKRGRTLYGAEVIVDSTLQHHGIGDKLYQRVGRYGVAQTVCAYAPGSRLRGYGSLCESPAARRLRCRGGRRRGARSHAEFSVEGRISRAGRGAALP